MTSSSAKKRAYHPFIWVGFYLQILPREVLQNIPRSTRHYHENIEQENLFGYRQYMENRQLIATLKEVANSKQLLAINKTLLKLFALKRFMTTYRHALKDKAGGVIAAVVANIEKVATRMPLKKCLRILQLDFTWWYAAKHKIRCADSLPGFCFIRHPAQLMKRETESIKSYLNNPSMRHWPLLSVYHAMRRNADAFFSKNSFYKYAALLKLNRSKPPHRRKKHAAGITAEKPLQLLHADVTPFICADQTRAYIYVMRDNASRAILHASASLQLKAKEWKQAMRTVYEKIKTMPAVALCIMSDGGSENRGVDDFIAEIKADRPIRRIIAQVDVPYSNSMAEAAHYMLKYYGLYHLHISDFEALQKALPQVIDDYNRRPNNVLDGLTPEEALCGIPKEKVFVASKNPITGALRIAENKSMMCCLTKK